MAKRRTYHEPVHTINGKPFTVSFVAGGWWYLRSETDGSMWRTMGYELESRMSLSRVES